MSSEIEELMPLSLGKGITMRLFVDNSKPEKPSWVEATYDGKEDSDVFNVPKHWHREHDEIMEVLEGRLIFSLDGRDRVVSAGDPPITIMRGTIHGFSAIKNERMRIAERNVPSGTFKARFFQDMFRDGPPGFLLAMRASYDADGYPSLPGGFKALDYVFVTIFGFLAQFLAPARIADVKRME